MPNTAPAAPAAPAALAQQPEAASAEKELCKMDHSPCRSAYRYQVYDNARRCKRVTLKRCKTDPTKKKMCATSKKGISRFTKKQLCQYIIGNPAFRSDDHIFQKNFEKVSALKRDLSETLQREFFTPMEAEEADGKKGTIGDTQRALYLARYSGGPTAVYDQKGGAKAYWTNYDEDEQEELEGWRLTFPSQFERFVRAARRRGIERIFVNMRLFKRLNENPEDDSKHANFLLVDIKNGFLYRYEPSGYGDLYDVFEMELLDNELAAWARKRGLKYVPPWDSCPAQLFPKVAALQRAAGKAERAEIGFCKVWSTFMLEQKLRHPDMDMNDLQKHFLKLFKDNNIDMMHFGNSYIRRVNQYGNRILREHGMKADADPKEYLEKHWKALMSKSVASK